MRKKKETTKNKRLNYLAIYLHFAAKISFIYMEHFEMEQA